MTDAIAIPEGERGIVRLFAVDLPEAEARAFAADPGAVARALGTGDLDPTHVEVFPVDRVAALGLTTYLAEGQGIAPSDLAPSAAALAALDGHVVLVTSGAFRGAARRLEVAPPLRLVGTWREETAPVEFGALPEGGAARVAPPPAPPLARPERQSRMTSRILTLAILVVAILGFLLLAGGQ
jgi:hypothetical protein